MRRPSPREGAANPLTLLRGHPAFSASAKPPGATLQGWTWLRAAQRAATDAVLPELPGTITGCPRSRGPAHKFVGTSFLNPWARRACATASLLVSHRPLALAMLGPSTSTDLLRHILRFLLYGTCHNSNLYIYYTCIAALELRVEACYPCARGRVEQVVRYVNAVFNQLHDLLDASAMVDPELD